MTAAGSGDEIVALWQDHRNAPWPHVSGPQAGPLMTLDTVISGCVTYYLESDVGLDEQRIEILSSCLEDLAALLEEVPEDSQDYFARLSRLGSLLLATHQQQ
jgi:hypothetical protein